MATLRLLSTNNPKVMKGEKEGFQTFILHLAPHTLSTHNVCAGATKGCIAACLNIQGRGGIGIASTAALIAGARNKIQEARIRKTRLYFEDRQEFIRQLTQDIAASAYMARNAGYEPCYRLNGTSDIRWELSNVLATFPRLQFYDYTKLANRRKLPSNYHLTFSLADGNDAAAARALENGMNCAVVFRNKETVARYVQDGFKLGSRLWPVFNGDDTDLRFRDPAGHVIGLYAKGSAKHDTSGFVRD